MSKWSETTHDSHFYLMVRISRELIEMTEKRTRWTLMREISLWCWARVLHKYFHVPFIVAFAVVIVVSVIIIKKTTKTPNKSLHYMHSMHSVYLFFWAPHLFNTTFFRIHILIKKIPLQLLSLKFRGLNLKLSNGCKNIGHSSAVKNMEMIYMIDELLRMNSLIHSVWTLNIR